MTIVTGKHITEQSTVPLTTHKKAAPVGYFLYCESVKTLRSPAAVIFGLGFPTLFFLIFSNTFSAAYASTYLASYAAYGAFIVSFQTFSISLANERSMGWNKLLRTTPMTVALYMGSKFMVIILTEVVSLLILFAVALISGKVHLAPVAWLQLLAMMTIGMIPTAILGIFLGFICSANLTTAISTTLLLLLSFTSGLFLPLSMLPVVMQKIAPLLPMYHLGQLAWIVVGSAYSRDSQPLWVHLLILLAYAVVFLILAVWAYARDENKNFV
jgi:ABC-2 type transport system permease protein